MEENKESKEGGRERGTEERGMRRGGEISPPRSFLKVSAYAIKSPIEAVANNIEERQCTSHDTKPPSVYTFMCSNIGQIDISAAENTCAGGK